MDDLLIQNNSAGWLSPLAAEAGRLAVRQEVFLDVVAVGLEQHVGAAQLADLLFGPLDHAVAFARLLIEHLPAAGHLEALLGAGLGLELGHLALLCGNSHGPGPGWPDFARSSVLIEHFTVATAALSAGRRKAGVMAEARRKYNWTPDSSDESGVAHPCRPRNDLGTIALAWELHGSRAQWAFLARVFCAAGGSHVGILAGLYQLRLSWGDLHSEPSALRRRARQSGRSRFQ